MSPVAKTDRAEFHALVRHSYFLRVSMNLAYDRAQQLERTAHDVGFPGVPQGPDEREHLTQLQVYTAKEIGGIKTRMLLDAPQEIEKHHFGPLQVALSHLLSVLERYQRISRRRPLFQDNALGEYCRTNHDFLHSLKPLRNSIVHQRADNLDVQKEFVEKFNGSEERHLVALLIDGTDLYEGYLRRLARRLREGG